MSQKSGVKSQRHACDVTTGLLVVGDGVSNTRVGASDPDSPVVMMGSRVESRVVSRETASVELTVGDPSVPEPAEGLDDSVLRVLVGFGGPVEVSPESVAA